MDGIKTMPITDAALRDAISAAQARVADEQDRFSKAEERLRGAEREFALLTELGRLRGLGGLPGANGSMGKAEDAADLSPRLTNPAMRRAAPARRDALVQTVMEILRSRGKPMPIRGLMDEVVSRGAPIPGRGEQANLISVITRVPEITRPERGVYGLREWEVDGAPAPAANDATGRRRGAR